jgi:hypothetical protein
VPSQAGDAGFARTSSPTTGYAFLGNGGAYVGFDGTKLQGFGGALNDANGFTAVSSAYGPTSATIATTSGTPITGFGLNLGAPNVANSSQIAFGNASTTSGSSHVTQIGSGGGAVAGVPLSGNANVFGVADASAAWLMELDNAGNLGIAAQYWYASERRLKDQIRPLDFNPLSIVENTNILGWCYKTSVACHRGEGRSYGPMADDAPWQLTGKARKSVNLSNAVFIGYAAIQQQQKIIDALSYDVKVLRDRLNEHLFETRIVHPVRRRITLPKCLGRLRASRSVVCDSHARVTAEGKR